MHGHRYCLAVLAGIVLAIAGCASGPPAQPYPLVGATDVYTLVNLHPDPARRKLTSVNYQLGGLIPLCTRVTILSDEGDSIRFKVNDTGEEYVYLRYKALQEPFHQHLNRYFGTTCNSAEVARLSEVDQKGVREGRVYPGMTKQGVIYAIGYPPDHATPSTASDQWRYWRSRFRTFVVHFNNGVVTFIQQ
jgi:hypothetical protein